MSKITSYKDLIIWQKSMDLVVKIYDIASKLPSEEKFGLLSQMRRAVISIPSNIAEGNNRGTRKDYRSFLIHSLGSCAELETQIEICIRLGYLEETEVKEILGVINELQKMLSVIIRKLNN